MPMSDQSALSGNEVVGWVMTTACPITHTRCKNHPVFQCLSLVDLFIESHAHRHQSVFLESFSTENLYASPKLPFDSSMTAYGDFSELDYHQLESLYRKLAHTSECVSTP